MIFLTGNMMLLWQTVHSSLVLIIHRGVCKPVTAQLIPGNARKFHI